MEETSDSGSLNNRHRVAPSGFVASAGTKGKRARSRLDGDGAGGYFAASLAKRPQAAIATYFVRRSTVVPDRAVCFLGRFLPKLGRAFGHRPFLTPIGLPPHAATCRSDVLVMFSSAWQRRTHCGQRVAILASPLHQLTGFYLSVDCRSTSCGGERAFAISDLASFYKERTVGDVLRLMRCSRGCGGRVLAAWLETGPVLNQRVRPRKVPLLGPEARE